jgi:hypothetical protein
MATLQLNIKRRLAGWAGQLTQYAKANAPQHLQSFIHTRVEESGAATFTLRVYVENKAPTGEGHYNYGSSDARAQEYGSGLQSRTSKKEYPIRARWKPKLVFMGTNEFSGQLIVIDEVSHPGIKPYHDEGYIRPAIKEFTPYMAANIAEDLADAVRTTLRTAFEGFETNGK